MTVLVFDRASGRRLREVSVTVSAGELIGVVGPRRGGKSELLELAAGVRPVGAGSVRLLDQPVGVRTRRLAGWAPDPPVALPELTAVEWLRYRAAHLSDGAADRDRRVRDALALVGLDGAPECLLRSWPRPALQRLGLAAAAVGDPPVLLLDEPLAGLDPHAATEVRAALARLAAAGRAIAIASHDLGALERLATRVLVLVEGRLVADIPTARLLGERVAEVALNGGGLRAAGWLLARFPGAARTGEGVAIPLQDGLTVEQVLAACRSQRIVVAGSRVRYRALEDLLFEASRRPR